MIEKISNRREQLQQKPSQEIIRTHEISWHALRGYDFAGLESILQYGLEPADNQQDHCVCLSTAPVAAWLADRPAHSFYTYTLRNGISLAIDTGHKRPTGDYGGFLDEIRVSHVQPDKIAGIMLPDQALSQPLVDMTTQSEPRKPQQAESYIRRTARHVQALGATIGEADQAYLQEAIELSRDGKPFSREQNDAIQAMFMNYYSQCLEQLGLEPTVGEMIQLVFARANKTLDVYGWTEEQKQEIDRRNTRESVQKVGACALGGSSIFGSDYGRPLRAIGGIDELVNYGENLGLTSSDLYLLRQRSVKKCRH
mgnify:FL=1